MTLTAVRLPPTVTAVKSASGGAGLTAYNEAAAPATPRFTAVPRSARQVQDVIRFCRDHHLRLSPYSTGHDFEGRSLSGDLALRLDAFQFAHYDPHTTHVTVGGGTRVYDINRALFPHGRAISTGTNQDVGITGLTLGGGAAYTSRLRGLTCDALLAVELVTFTGEHLQVTDDSHPGLMRLLRGAGGGHFGVVLSLTFQTYATAPVTTFRAQWPLGTAALTAELEERLIQAPTALSMRVGAVVSGPDFERRVTLSGQCFGSEAHMRSHFGVLRRSAHWAEQTLPYAEAMAGARHQSAGGSFKIKSRYAFAPLGEAGLAPLLDHLQQWTPSRNPDGAGFGLFAWGGQIPTFPADRSCVPGRHAEYLASFDAAWTADDDHATRQAQLRWVHDLDRLAGPSLSGAAYVNFPDSDDNGYAQRHLHPFADDLRAWTDRLDPDHLGRQRSLTPVWPPNSEGDTP
ncbi:FAD-binding oxidoreductase [uncultured Deinococcus sp.]|uniref:FAD-binding oxidoreductase n=1 Tax=uncultured Deinococcus sp. TaxID=158789 RepID=UPI0025E732D0|nr:FAD-dependent oxidoreductase [uncultured Deinococcus sp.]